jgi:uncharacterized protein YcbK (DUF882 family)
VNNAHALRVLRYEEWLHAQGLRFGFAKELAGLATNVTRGVTNDIPPVEKWHLILPTVRMVEQVRERFGPTTLTSGYRALPYNIAVGGEKASWHSRNVALDFQCREGTPEQWGRFLQDLRARGDFSGGIGIYDRFVHVDTRGTNADWRGK